MPRGDILLVKKYPLVLPIPKEQQKIASCLSSLDALIEAQRWQVIGMHTTGMSFKAIGRQMGYHYTVVSRLVRKHTQTNNVKDLPRPGRPKFET
jgi:restriction endonuclease S subunit